MTKSLINPNIHKFIILNLYKSKVYTWHEPQHKVKLNLIKFQSVKESW